MVLSQSDVISATPVDLTLPPAGDTYDPAADADRLPDAAKGLADILQGQEVHRLAADYAVADARAVAAQAHFFTMHRWEVNAATLAAITGAVFLSPLGDQLSGLWRSIALVFQYTALAAALGLGLCASWLGTLDTWREERFAAEDLRTELFRAILKPAGTAILPSQLAYFVERLFRPQLVYFKHKTDQHRAELETTSMWKWFGAAMLAVIATIGTLSFVALLKEFGVQVWGWLVDLAIVTKPLDHPRVLLALGVIASTLQNVATMRAQISLSGRNAERFSMLADRFKQLAEMELPRARQAAELGDGAGVRRFTDAVMREMDAEAKAWRDVRGAIRPLGKVPWRKDR